MLTTLLILLARDLPCPETPLSMLPLKQGGRTPEDFKSILVLTRKVMTRVHGNLHTSDSTLLKRDCELHSCFEPICGLCPHRAYDGLGSPLYATYCRQELIHQLTHQIS